MKATRELTITELASIKNALRSAIGVSCKKYGQLVGLEAGLAQPHLPNCSVGRALFILENYLNPPKDLTPQLVASLDKSGRVDVRVK